METSGTPQDTGGRIAGGSLTDDGEFPFMASVQLNRRHICGGFIYSDRWIVTTASCVFGCVTNIMF